MFNNNHCHFKYLFIFHPSLPIPVLPLPQIQFPLSHTSHKHNIIQLDDGEANMISACCFPRRRLVSVSSSVYERSRILLQKSDTQTKNDGIGSRRAAVVSKEKSIYSPKIGLPINIKVALYIKCIMHFNNVFLQILAQNN